MENNKAKIGPFNIETGKAISLKQVAEELSKLGIEIDKRKFVDKGPLDELGFHHIGVELYKGVIGKVHVQILGEEK